MQQAAGGKVGVGAGAGGGADATPAGRGGGGDTGEACIQRSATAPVAHPVRLVVSPPVLAGASASTADGGAGWEP